MIPNLSTVLSPSDSMRKYTSYFSVSITSLLVSVLLYTYGVMTVLLIQRLNKHYRKMRLDYYLCTYNIVKLEIVIIHEQAWATFQDRGVTWSMPVSYPEPASLHADKEVTYLVVWGWGMKTLNTGNLKKLLYKVSN